MFTQSEAIRDQAGNSLAPCRFPWIFIAGPQAIEHDRPCGCRVRHAAGRAVPIPNDEHLLARPFHRRGRPTPLLFGFRGEEGKDKHEMEYRYISRGSHRQKNPIIDECRCPPVGPDQGTLCFNIQYTPVSCGSDWRCDSLKHWRCQPNAAEGVGIATASLLTVEKKKTAACLRQPGSFNRARQESSDSSEKRSPG